VRVIAADARLRVRAGQQDRCYAVAATDALVGLSFLGGEALILLGDESWARRVRTALRSLVTLIRNLEETPPG
jgi:hypothetical protein